VRESRHSISYRIRNTRVDLDPPRTVEVEASRDDICSLVNDGYLVRKRLIGGELLDELRRAADEIESSVSEKQGKGTRGDFGGLFVRDLIDRHTAFHKLIDFPPLLSVARAVIGPQVQVHASVLRVSYPELGDQRVEWHFHQRVVPDPLPPWFYRPALVDNLIYLDDITPESGPLVVLPGSHQWDEDLPSGDHSDKPGQVVVTVPAGSVVTSHSSLLHKALPTLPTGTRRRLIIIGYSPVWMRQVDRPSAGSGHGLTDDLTPNATEEMRELLGLSGYY
jgi:ectoine hydroxylase-related dioxygenase (phytanoyl-CoA dioxygenase family)